MSDRNLVTYEEPRNPEGPYWRLAIDRLSSGQPGLVFTISVDHFNDMLPREELTVVVADGDALLKPVLEWLDAGSGWTSRRLFGVDEIILIANETSDNLGNLYRIDFIERIKWEAGLESLSRPWTPADGDTRCQECGLPNPVWWVPHEDWNRVTGSEGGILCPTCYHVAWISRGMGQ
jgi:hypothetical protein